MSDKVADRFDTQAVRYLYRTILMEEEHRPLPDDQSPAMLVERVRGHVDMVEEMIGNYEREYCVADLTVVAVQLMWLGAAAITAAVHIDPDCNDLALTELKDGILPLIDECVAQALEDECDGDSFCPRELLEPCASFLLEADDDEELENAAVALLKVASSATIALALVERRRLSD